MRPLPIALAALLVLVQAGLWFGKGSAHHVMTMQAQLDEQQRANDAARERNRRLAAEVTDLAEGLEIIEERARADLGMLRPDEILVQVNPKR